MLSRSLTSLGIFASILLSCKQSGNIPELSLELTNKADFSITHWKLIGPFQSNTPHWIKSGPFNQDSINGAVLFKQDVFTLYGLTEDKLTQRDIPKLKLNQTPTEFIIPDSVFIDYHNLHGMIDLESAINTNKPGVIYAACIIKSKKEQDVVFLSGGDECAQLFVNGTLYESPVQNPYRLVYQNYIFAHLKKGRNFILLKSSNTTKSWTTANTNETWRHILNICSPRRFNDYYLKLEKMHIKKPVVPFQHPLHIQTPIHPIDPVLKVEIRDISDSIVLTPEYSNKISIDMLDFGYYELRLITAKNSYKQGFYYGDIYTGIKPHILQAKELLNEIDIDFSSSLLPLVERHDILHEYYMANYFKISEADENKEFKTIDSVVVNPTRLVHLNSSNYVKLDTIKLWRNPIAGIQFYNKSENKYKLLPYLQTNNKNDLSEIQVQDTSVFLSPSNNPFLSDLFFSFPHGERPEYMQILTYDTLSNREIDRRYVFLYKNIRDILDKYSKGEAYTKNIPGTHIRSFISEVEEKPQYYIVQAPETVKTDTSPKPLIVIVPWVFNDNYPFLRSFIVADIHIHEMYEWQVNLNDFIVVHSNARTYEKVVTEPLSVNNVLRTIDAVRKDYNIDTTRIHLFAYCGGSELATILAEKFPSKFASLGIVAGFAMNPSNQWSVNNYALNFTENLTNTPIRIIHGELDTHTPIGSMIQFVDIAKQNGNKKLEFVIEKGLTFEAYPRLRHHEEMFSFFKENAVSTPSSVTFSTTQHKYHKAYWLSLFPKTSGSKASVKAVVNNNTINIEFNNAGKCVIYTNEAPVDKESEIKVVINNTTKSYTPPIADTLIVWNTDTSTTNTLRKNRFVEGPILNAFSEKFILVKGTMGSASQTSATSNLIDQIVGEWKAKYHVSPTVKSDIELSNEDILKSNLILFGNQHTNKYIHSIYQQIPLVIGKNQIKLYNEIFEGESIGFWIAYPNPKNQNKHIVLVGGNNLNQIIPRKGIPALNGFYDYEIYSYKDGYQYVLDNGIFNDHWTLDD